MESPVRMWSSCGRTTMSLNSRRVDRARRAARPGRGSTELKGRNSSSGTPLADLGPQGGQELRTERLSAIPGGYSRSSLRPDSARTPKTECRPESARTGTSKTDSRPHSVRTRTPRKEGRPHTVRAKRTQKPDTKGLALYGAQLVAQRDEEEELVASVRVQLQQRVSDNLQEGIKHGLNQVLSSAAQVHESQVDVTLGKTQELGDYVNDDQDNPSPVGAPTTPVNMPSLTPVSEMDEYAHSYHSGSLHRESELARTYSELGGSPH